MLYLLKFKPILKTVVWGGSMILPFKGLDRPADGSGDHIGESWELSGVKGNESVVADGPLAGRTITELARTYGAQLLGEKVFAATGEEFPLLIKFIDAQGDLSVQVHPDDALAARRHNGSKGKTEMWYVVDAAPGAHLLSGLSAPLDPDSYVRRVEDGSIMDVLQRYEVQPGDVFFLPAGRIHAIGAGCFIAEIQQTSDITYRIYDYNRPGLDGKPRQLHTELAKDAIDYRVLPDYRTHYEETPNRENEVVKCPYFTTSLLQLDQALTVPVKARDSFLVVLCTGGEGSVSIEGEPDSKVSLHRGETLLVPACAENVTFAPEASGMTLLTSHL